MSGVLIGVVIVMAALVLWLVFETSREQKKSALLVGQMNELRRDLQTIGTAQAQSSGQMASIAQSVSQRLESVTKALQDGVSNSAQIATQGQTAIADELKKISTFGVATVWTLIEPSVKYQSANEPRTQASRIEEPPV